MAGKVCPNCGEQTLFLSKGKNRECSNCHFQLIVPPNSGKGGSGKKCANCGARTVFNGVCKNCGAKYVYPKTK